MRKEIEAETELLSIKNSIKSGRGKMVTHSTCI